MGKHSIFQKKPVMVIAALLACVLWGSAFPSLKITYAELAVTNEFVKILLAGLRFSLAGLGVLAFAKIKQKVRLTPARSELPLIAVLAVFQISVSYAFYYVGLSYTTGVKASILSSVSVFFVAVFSHFTFKSDRLSWKKALGLLCGFAGVVMVNLTIIAGTGFSFSFAGEGLLILHAAFIAMATVLIRKYSHSVDVIRINGWQLLIGGVLLIAVGYAGNPEIPAFNTVSAILLVYTAALSAVAFTLWFVLLKYHKASAVEQYKFAVPLFGSLLSVIFVSGEHMGIEMLVAAALVAAGIIIVNRADSARI
ncbi:MAG: DMT family transporter [Eubacteriales bacterium]|nr:DMT family transporter [Eubacteriales bacterium]